MRKITPKTFAEGAVNVPGSKSQTQRFLIIGSLAKGKTIIANPSVCDDTIALLKALELLGVTVEQGESSYLSGGKYWTLEGLDGRIPAWGGEYNLEGSGAGLRFFTSLTALGRGTFYIDGNDQNRKRPCDHLLDTLQRLGVSAYSEKSNGCPPIIIEGKGIRGGTSPVKGVVSSQFLSSILMVAPYARKEIDLNIEGQQVSMPYILLTAETMRTFGVHVKNHNNRKFFVPNDERYIGQSVTVESDVSSASYFWAAAAITGGRVRVKNISRHSLQGDIKFLDHLESMGSRVVSGEDNDGTPYIEVIGGRLKGVEVSMRDTSDIAPTLAIVALFADGKTIIKDVPHLKYKESDRLTAIANELRDLGAEIEETEDSIAITPNVEKYRPTEFQTYNDHRLVMSLSLVGLRVPGTRVRNPNCVAKSFPDFFAQLESL